MQVLVVALNPERGEEECAITINALLHNPKLGQAAAQHLQAIYSETVAAAPLHLVLSLGVATKKKYSFLKKWDEMYYGCIFGGLTSLSYTSYLNTEKTESFYG